MRDPTAWRLTFLLPKALQLAAATGRQHPCLHGCLVTVTQDCLAAIEGPSRERVFEQARRFLVGAARGHGAFAIAAALESPPQPARLAARAQRVGGRDSWTIVIGADVAFVATGLGADLFTAI